MSGAVEVFPKLYLVGLKTTLRRAGELSSDRSGIAPLWTKVMTELASFENRVGTDRYALITGDLIDRSGGPAEYYALIAVKDFHGIDFEKWAVIERGPGRWYRFSHTGPPEKVGYTVAWELQETFVAKGYPTPSNEELFIYSAEYDRTNPQCKFEVALFLAD